MTDIALLAAGLALLLASGVVAHWFRRRRLDSETSSPSTIGNRNLKPAERHVLRLLGTHDGQLRQSEIVDRLDWSKSKVSRLLSNLEAAGEIEKVNRGRENLVVLENAEAGRGDETNSP